MIRLYHGSNVAIEQIDLSQSKRGTYANTTR